jgi:outer membrane protein W
MIRIPLLALAFWFLLHTSIKAQTISIGPTLGANFSTINDINNSKNLTGITAGAFGNYSVNEHLGITLKLLFSQLGVSTENPASTTRLNYFQIPLTGVYYFGQSGNKIRPKIYAGPYLGFLLDAKDKDGNPIINSIGASVFNKTDIGALMGVGLNYLLTSRTWLNVDIGYARSLIKIRDISTPSYKNSCLQFAVGVSFPLSR